MKTVTKEKCDRLFKTLDPLSKVGFKLNDDQLYSLWVKVSKVSGWAGIIGNMKLLPEDVLLKLEVLDDEMSEVLKREEKYYYSEVVPCIRKSLIEFKKEMLENDLQFVKDRRSEYLKNEIKELGKEIERIFENFKKNGFSFMGDIILKINKFSYKKKKLKRLLFEYRNIKNPEQNSSGISEEDIEMAKEYPFEELIESKKKFAICPYHNDHHASFYIKGNFGYCFSCGKSVDTIQFVMDTKNISFKEAVHFLTS